MSEESGPYVQWHRPWDRTCEDMRRVPCVNYLSKGAWCAHDENGKVLVIFLHGYPWSAEWWAKHKAKRVAKRHKKNIRGRIYV